MRTVKKQKQHYVDNQEFLAAIVKYKEKVFIAACKAVEASSRAWAMSSGGACDDDADRSSAASILDVALLIAALDHFSGKLLFVIFDSLTAAAAALCDSGRLCCLLVC